MCVILYLKPGTDKKDPFLKEAIKKASEYNKDGMGYAIKQKDNKIYLDKGYFDVDTFIEAIEKQDVQVDEELLIHLRIGNVGQVNADMCHPFVVSSELKEITSTNEGFTDKPVLCHNGTMWEHSYAKSKVSDTVHFIQDVISYPTVMDFLKADPAVFEEVMEPHLRSSRLAIMHPNDSPTNLLGKWYEYNGIQFSKDYKKEYFPVKQNYSADHKKNYHHYKKRDQDYYDQLAESYYNQAELEYMESKNNGVQSSLFADSFIENIKNNSIKSSSFIPNHDVRETISSINGVRYTLYMGFYLPDSIELGFSNYNLEITNELVGSVGISCTKVDYIRGFSPGLQYELDIVDEDEVGIVEVSSGELTYIDKSDFYAYFILWPHLGTSRSFYDDLYDMVLRIPVSKNMIKKFNKKLDAAISKNLDEVVFRNTVYEVNLAVRFLQLAEEELDLVKNPHKLLY